MPFLKKINLTTLNMEFSEFKTNTEEKFEILKKELKKTSDNYFGKITVLEKQLNQIEFLLNELQTNFLTLKYKKNNSFFKKIFYKIKKNIRK